jgi:16S rRNA (uracil1498-N3)-methyltransferase
VRRVHVPDLRPGVITPDPAQAHHLRSVLRLTAGEIVEAFDATGRTATAEVVTIELGVTLRIESITPPPAVATVIVAAAVPKGDRADWMIEKLSEVGAARFIPLRTARSVVHPEGRSKTERWERIAIESAKQCRRSGVLAISPLTDLRTLLPTLDPPTTIFFSTRPDATRFQAPPGPARAATLLIGPEGDWSPDEEAAFVASGLTAASLGPTILRVETAAVFAAGLAQFLMPPPA